MVAYADETLASELAVGARGLALSRTGGVILLNGAKVWDVSRRQTASSSSTPKTSVVAAALVVQRVVVLRRHIVQLTGSSLEPTTVYLDNKIAIKMVHRRILGPNPRHIRIALNVLVTALDSKDIQLRWVDSQGNVADIYCASESAARLRRNLDVILGIT